jgi:hypothetical protein
MTTTEPTPEDLGRDLAADLSLCAAAAPGPWRQSQHLTSLDPSHWCIPILAGEVEMPAHCYGRRYRNANAAFIAAAREGWPAALRRLMALEAAVRKHRDTRGDDRCHADDGELYAALPEGDTRPARETAVTLENCARYVECRQAGREYVSPQRRIEELEATLRHCVEAMAEGGCNTQEDALALARKALGLGVV